MALPALRILVFKTEGCPACAAMDKQQTLEKFIAKQDRSVTVHRLVCANTDEEVDPKSASYDAVKAKNYDLSNDYDVRSYPVFVLEAKLPDGTGLELARVEGVTTLKEFTHTFDNAIGAVENQYEADEGTRTQNAASKEVPW